MPAQHAEIIARISAHFGLRVEILGLDDEWVQFRVPGWVETTAAIHMEMQKDRILGAAADTFQILAPQYPRGGEGLWIRSIQGPGGQRNGEPGIWFY